MITHIFRVQHYRSYDGWVDLKGSKGCKTLEAAIKQGNKLYDKRPEARWRIAKITTLTHTQECINYLSTGFLSGKVKYTLHVK